MKNRPIRGLISLASAACLLPSVLHAQSGVPTQPQQQSPGQSAVTPTGPTTSDELPLHRPLGTPPLPDPGASRRVEPEALQFRAIAGVERDSNVLRTPTNERSDNVGVLGVGVHFDRRYGQQRIVADAEASTFRHQDLDELDYSTLNYSLAWNWRFSNFFEGVASAERRQYRDIADTAGGVSRIGRRTDRNELLEGGYRLGGGAWRVLAGVQNTAARSSDPRNINASPKVQSVHAGTSYEFASGSVISARVKRGDGEYENSPGASSFEDNQIETTVRWAATAKTTFDGRLAHVDRKHDTTPRHDFSGLVGSAHVSWDATAKTRLVAGIERELGSYVFVGGGHVENQRIFLAPVWRASEQFVLNARYERARHDWRDIATGSIDSGREDIINTLSAGLDWQPRRAITVSTTLRNERRRSSLPGLNYKANIIGVGVKVTL